MRIDATNFIRVIHNFRGSSLESFFSCFVIATTIVLFAGGAIPDAAAIHAARKKREAAREKGGKEDFIPIKNVEKKSSKGPRLLREEDEDDDEERICFTVKEKAKEDEYHKKVGKDREAHDDSDSDPEWEKMQISKAINNQQV